MKTLLARFQRLKRRSFVGSSCSDTAKDLQSSVSESPESEQTKAQINLPLTSSAAVFLVPYN